MSKELRSFSFGRDGEQSWRRMSGAYRIAGGSSQRAVLVSESREVRDEARRRLESLGPIHRLEPSAGIVDEVQRIGAEGQGGELPIAWVEAPRGAEIEDAWAEALIALNRGRDLIGDRGPVFLVLAGEGEFAALLARQAPDLSSVISPRVELGEELEALVEPTGPLCWLHISDLHIQSKDWQQDVVLRGLLRDLPGLLERAQRRPQLVFVTGDVAYSGKAEQYVGARAFFEELLEILELEREQLFLVPGNHDVDRGAIDFLAKAGRDTLLAKDPEARRSEVGKLVGDPGQFAHFGKRLAGWCEFTDSLLGPARGVSTSQPWRSDVVKVAGVEVGVAQLCTAWLSGPDDGKGKLVLGERQLRQLADELDAAGPQLKVALHHHPLDWLDDLEQETAEAILDDRFDLVLFGHRHLRDARSFDRGRSGGALWLAAGAAYDPHGGDRWHGFSVGQLDAEQGQLTVDAFTWTSHEGGRWHPDASFDRDSGTNRRTLSFRLSKLGESEAPAGSKLDALVARIRQSAERVYSSHAFTGMPAGSLKPRVSLTDIYVPIRLDISTGHLPALGPGMSWREVLKPLSGLSDHKELDEIDQTGFEAQFLIGAEPARRYVVLGGPGSGKSTLCRYLALMAAQGDKWTPLLVTGRDWAEAGARESLFELASRQLTTSLAVPVDPRTVAELCEHGEVLLLVDGIDELGGRDRVRLRDMIQGFATAHPNASVIVTSRELGYDEVPLDATSFTHLQVQPFDDERIREFVERWYAVAEPHDGARRIRGQAEFLAALAAEPRAQELARTPLLLTLIALVHRERASLPGRRARLYELCVDLLVIAWPEAAERSLREVPGEWQVNRLEELALWMQRVRADEVAATGMIETKGGVLVARRELESKLRELLAAGGRSQPGEGRPLARRWLRWLVESGLLQEQRHDAFGFLHLSLMEYLAGQALLREQLAGGHAQLANFVLEHHGSSVWAEVLLLMLGSDAADAALCDAVVDALLDSESRQLRRPEFLLALLREEVGLSGQRRDRLLEWLCSQTLSKTGRAWTVYRNLTGEILRFSKTHGDAVRRWLEAQLGRRTGSELLAVLALTPNDPGLATTLRSRDSEELQLQPVLELGSADAWGRWAMQWTWPATWLSWAASTTPRGVLTYALMSLDEGFEELSAVWVLGLLRRMFWIGGAAEPPGEAGRPRCLAWRMSGVEIEVPTEPSLRCRRTDGTASLSSSAPGYLETALWDSSLQLSLSFSPKSRERRALAFSTLRRVQRYSRFLQVIWVSENVGRWFRMQDGQLVEDTELGASFAGFVHELYGTSLDEVLDQRSLELKPVRPPPRPRPPQRSELPWRVADELGEALSYFASFYSGLLAAGRSSSERDVIAEAYVHNLWLNFYFDVIVGYARGDDDLTPTQHALLLALGLAQFQTTWRWPMSEQWRSWFTDGTPPEDWLAAHVWHLCWAVAEPEHPEHLERAKACLERGDWPELVEALREYAIVPYVAENGADDEAGGDAEG